MTSGKNPGKSGAGAKLAIGFCSWALVWVALRGACGSVGMLVEGAFDHSAYSLLALYCLGFVASVLVATFVALRPTTLADRAAILVVPMLIAADYGAHMQEISSYGTWDGIRQLGARVERVRWDNHVLRYRFNEAGFRGPRWTPRAAPGVTRIAVIGDSFVFGQRLEQTDTLSAQLDRRLGELRPDTRFETLNLGVPGSTWREFAELALIARDRFHADALVVTTNIVGDTSRWTFRHEVAHSRRFGTYSVACWLLGARATATIWSLLYNEGGRGRPRTAAIHRALMGFSATLADRDVPVVTFSYQRLHPIIDGLFVEALGSAPIHHCRETEPGMWIPGDGYVRALCNAYVADRIAPLLLSALTLPPAVPTTALADPTPPGRACVDSPPHASDAARSP